MDRLVMHALRLAVQAREHLADALRETSHDDPDFPALLAAVRDSRLLSVAEIANLVGLSRSRTYELISEGERRR